MKLIHNNFIILQARTHLEQRLIFIKQMMFKKLMREQTVYKTFKK